MKYSIGQNDKFEWQNEGFEPQFCLFFCPFSKKVAKKLGGFVESLYLCTRQTENGSSKQHHESFDNDL